MVVVNWIEKIVFVSRDELELIQTNPIEVRVLDINLFRQEINSIQASDGMPFPTIIDHTPPSPISGIELARVVRIINGYTITFEDGRYAVNLIGGNTNIGDQVNINQVSVRTSNSAGLVNVSSGSSSSEVWTETEKDRVLRDTSLIPAII